MLVNTTCIWNVYDVVSYVLMGTGVLATIGAISIAISVALTIVSVVWNIPQISAAIYYTIKDGGFKLRKHSWIVTWYIVGGLH